MQENSQNLEKYNDYNLKVAQLTLSGMQIVGGVALMPFNPLVANGFINSGFETGAKTLQQESCSMRDYCKTAGSAFATTFVSGGTTYFFSESLGIFLVSGLSKTAVTALQYSLNQKDLPTGKKMFFDFVVSSISGGFSKIAFGTTARLSRSALHQVIHPFQSKLATVATEGLTASSAATAREITAIAIENILYKRPITQNVSVSSLLANATFAGVASGLEAFNSPAPVLEMIKVVRRGENGNKDIILWSGSEEDYHQFNIEENLKALSGTMDTEELRYKLAELSGQIKKIEPLVPEDQWNRPITAKEIVNNAENVSGINAIRRASYLSDVMACMLWGGDPANHDPDAKNLIYKQFLKDQSNSKRAYQRLVNTVSTLMMQAAAAHASRPIIEQYEQRLPLTEETVRLLNTVPHKDLLAQIFIEKVDLEFKAEGYTPLTKIEKSNFSLLLHGILEKHRTRDQEDDFIKMMVDQLRGHFPSTESAIANVIAILYRSEQLARTIANLEMPVQLPDVEPRELERNHKSTTQFVKDVIRKAKLCVRSAFKEGLGVNIETDGEDVKATVGPVKLPHSTSVYNSADKGPFIKQFDTKVKKIVQTSNPNVSSSTVPENIPIQNPAYYVPAVPKKETPSQGKKRKYVPAEKNNKVQKQPENEDIELSVKTQKSTVSRNKKGQKQYRNEKGQFCKKPWQGPVHRNNIVNKPEIRLTNEGSSIGRMSEITYIPSDPDSEIKIGLTQSTSAYVGVETNETGLPGVYGSLNSHLEIADTEKMKLNVLEANFNATIKPKEIDLSAQVSGAKVQTTFEIEENCWKDVCKKAIVTVELHFASIGARMGFGQTSKPGVKTTEIKAGIGGGLFGLFTRAELIETENESNSSDVNQLRSNLPDMKRLRKN